MRKYNVHENKLAEITEKLREVKIGVIGDFCLDVYWRCDMTKSELSRETPHYPLPVVEERISLGGAGNVAANMAALGPAALRALCVIGDDWRGTAMRGELARSGISDAGVIRDPSVTTPAYCKPIRCGISPVEYEDPRLDFANYAPLTEKTEDALLKRLDSAVEEIDLLCVCDQLAFGCITPRIRERIIALARDGLRITVDSRDRIGLYTGENITLKPNHIEAARALNLPPAAEDDLACQREVLLKLSARNNSPVCMTLGPSGCLYTDGAETTHIPTIVPPPPLDFVGAGDTFLSAFSLALAAGLPACDAAALGNRASWVTIRKIGTTGTASPAEIVAL